MSKQKIFTTRKSQKMRSYRLAFAREGARIFPCGTDPLYECILDRNDTSISEERRRLLTVLFG